MANQATATLTVRDGKQRGLSFVVLPTTTIGRSTKSTVQLDDPDISRTHVVIEIDAGEYVVRDNGSANGTFLNGRRINNAALRHGDVIALGSSTLLFQVGVVRVPSAQAVEASRASTEEAPFAHVTRAAGVDALDAVLTKYKVLFQTNELLARLNTRGPAFGEALQLLAEVMRADAGLVLLGAIETNVTVAAEYTRTGVTQHTALSSTLLKRVLGDGEAVLVRDTLHDDRLSDAESVLATGSRSMVCVPLRAHDRTFGALQLECWSRPVAFDDDDLQMVVALARQAALALSQAQVEQARADAVERSALQRFVAPSTAELLRAGSTPWRLGAAPTVTMLFIDLRPVTVMLDGPALAAVNVLCDELLTAVFARRGTVSRLTPDALFACWGAPLPEAEAARLSVECALDVAALWHRSPFGPAAALRGLVHAGRVFAGEFGAASRRDYAVMGKEVERAAKLSALVPTGAVAVTEPVYRELSTQVMGEWLSQTSAEGRVFLVKALR